LLFTLWLWLGTPKKVWNTQVIHLNTPNNARATRLNHGEEGKLISRLVVASLVDVSTNKQNKTVLQEIVLGFQLKRHTHRTINYKVSEGEESREFYYDDVWRVSGFSGQPGNETRNVTYNHFSSH
jgi:hypothetical protein